MNAKIIKDNHWSRTPDDLAVRIGSGDIAGIFKKEIIIEPGCKAILIVDGKHSATLPPGRYTVGGLKKKFSFSGDEETTVILVDDSDVSLNFHVSDLFTSDPLKVDLDCLTIFNLEEPVLFFTNVMKGAQSYSLSELEEHLKRELTNVISSRLQSMEFSELTVDRSALDKLGLELEAHLRMTLKREGLHFIQVRALDVRQEGMSWILNTRSKIQEKLNEVRVESERLGIKRAEVDIYRETTDVILDELRTEKEREREKDRVELQHSRERLEIWDKLRDAENLDKMSILTRDDEWESFQNDVDKKKLLRKVEWEALQNTVKEKEDDRVTARQYLLDKIRLERDQELKKLQLHYSYEIDKADRVEELEILKDGITREATLKESERAELELDVIAKINRQLKQTDADLTIAKQRAQTETEIAEIDAKKSRIEIDLDRYEAEQGIKTMAQMKAVKREDKEEQSRIEREDWAFREKMKHEHEIEKTELLSKLGPSALISASGPEQAKLLAELQKSEILKGMDQDAILAMAAKDSPEVAQAMAEMYKSRSSEETIKLYEQMLDRTEKMTDKVERAHREGAERAERMFHTGMETKTQATEDKLKQTERETERVEKITDKAMDKMGDTAVAKAGATDGSSGKMCPKCRTQNALGSNFCLECGYQFK